MDATINNKKNSEDLSMISTQAFPAFYFRTVYMAIN
jgi:hypothetical protein